MKWVSTFKFVPYRIELLHNSFKDFQGKKESSLRFRMPFFSKRELWGPDDDIHMKWTREQMRPERKSYIKNGWMQSV